MAEGGLVVANNETIRSFLLSAATRCGGGGGGSLGAELRDLASYLSSQSSVPYRSLRAIWFAIPAAERPPLRRLFNGADFVFSSPKPREKSEELKERLKKLAEMAERREYAELVKDVAPKKEISEPFSSYKDQIGFGLHVVLMMFTGYLVGYAAFRALFNHSAVMVTSESACPLKNAAGGILGLVCGMLLETVLFIIRTSNRDLDSSNSNSRLKKHQ
ncbi:uncharacterized protein LOC109713692 isoform X1 [Ananas comosus]|uniref:Uncharacterized protein LOC109713692 isoform X1 n=1 Tax=Ananas comosus TaxID=4615 RepID=A0A6P5FCX7_ANACO|nr:uncharacterized protein LOC109713692 isoform X1 [Ananas comosus]